MEEMNTIEMQAQESAAGTAGYAESTAPAGPETPQGDLHKRIALGVVPE